jgi:hypothetical protein
MAKRYRKRALDKTAQRMVEFLEQRGIEGVTVLEVGGGVGDIQVELLKRGAAGTVNLELSSAYDAEAERLLQEAGQRAERRLDDIAVEPDAVEPADVVVLHRVVCCYPDYERLLGAAAEHARRLIVFSYPPRNAVSLLFVAAENLIFRLLRKEFRSFAQTFQGRNFVICSFCPRKLDLDPLAVPIPSHHSNLQSEEMIYYVSGKFGSRRGVDVGSITLHLSGLPHGPQSGLAEKSIGTHETHELPVIQRRGTPPADGDASGAGLTSHL